MSEIIKLYPAWTAVSATESALFRPPGQTTFYFLPSLQRCLPLWVDLLKSWLRGRPKDGETKKGGSKRRREGEGGVEINLLTLFTLTNTHSHTHTHTDTVALPAQASDEAEHTHKQHKSSTHPAKI